MMSLLSIPQELLLQIIEHISNAQDKQTLQSLATTCTLLRDIAEAYLYSSAVFTTKSSLNRFLQATEADHRRNLYLQHLELAFSTHQHDYAEPAPRPEFSLFQNLRRLVSESPESQPWSPKNTVAWKTYMEIFMRAFEEASLVSDVPESRRPLQKLTSRKF